MSRIENNVYPSPRTTKVNSSPLTYNNSSSVLNSNEQSLLLTRNLVDIEKFVTDTVHTNSALRSPSAKYIQSQNNLRRSSIMFAREHMKHIGAEEDLEHSTLSLDSGSAHDTSKEDLSKVEEEVGDYPDTLSESSSDDSINSDRVARHIELYKKLPPPSIQMVPFNLFRDEESDNIQSLTMSGRLDLGPDTNFDVSTREDFEKLKARTIRYIDKLHGMIDQMFGKDPNEYVVYYNYLKEKVAREEGSKLEKDEKKQPTTIQYLKALERASDIIEEVDRSRMETKLKTKASGANRKQPQTPTVEPESRPKPLGFVTSPISPASKIVKLGSPSKDTPRSVKSNSSSPRLNPTPKKTSIKQM